MVLKRTVHASTLAAIAAPFHAVTMVFVDWPTGEVRLHSGAGDLTWGGETWTGAAGLNAAISLPGEGAGIAMLEGSLIVTGDDTRIDDVYDSAEDAAGRAVQVYFGVVTSPGGTTLVGDPFEVFTGRIGALSDETIWQGEDQARPLTIGLETGPSQRSRGGVTHSYRDQLAYDATDTAGRWLYSAVAQAILTAQRRS